MKTYTYTVFLRHPETKEFRYVKLQFDHDGYMDSQQLFEKLNNCEVIKSDLVKGYTLLSMQIIDVEDKE